MPGYYIYSHATNSVNDEEVEDGAAAGERGGVDVGEEEHLIK